MKKSMISKLVVLVVVMIVAGGFAFGANDTLDLQGTVTEALTISIAADALATTIDLDTGHSDATVATATVSSNAMNGYKITANSLNKDGSDVARLKTTSTLGDEFFIDYSLTFAGQSVDFDNATPFYTSEDNTIFTATEHIIALTVAGDDGSYRAGTYTDTVTFTIAAN